MPPGLSDRCTLSAASASIYTAPTTCHWLYGAMRPAFLVCQAVACTCATQIDSGGARSRTAVTSVELAIQGGKLVHEQSIFRIAGLCTCMPHAARWQLERVCQVCVCVCGTSYCGTLLLVLHTWLCHWATGLAIQKSHSTASRSLSWGMQDVCVQRPWPWQPCGRCEDYRPTRDRKRARHLAGIIIPTTS